jgi:2-desacetyl-2-hydroxyethyl bacteriochlorophyllide A dehydrogenase
MGLPGGRPGLRKEGTLQARRIVFSGTRQAEWQAFELPDQPGPHEVLVETLWSAVSIGTEMAIYAGTHIGFRTPGSRYPRYPYLAGYAATGTVLAIGSGVHGLAPGQVVAFPGKHASHGIWDVRQQPVVAVPEGVAPDEAALTRLATISLNGMRLPRLSLGESVVVLGAGLIGQFAAQFGQLSGGWPVALVDRLANRLAIARACGIALLLDVSDRSLVEAAREVTQGRGFDVVVEATGAAPVVAQAFELAAQYGRVVLLGSPRGRIEIDPYTHIHSPGVTIIGAHAATTPGVETVASRWTARANFALALDLLAHGKLVVGPLISHRLPAAGAVGVYEAIVAHPDEYLGVLLAWDGEEKEAAR